MPEPTILLPGDHKAAERADKQAMTRAFVNRILSHPVGSPERWQAIFQVWYGLEPNAKQDHLDAVREAAMERATIKDKNFGRTDASLGRAHGSKWNKNIDNKFVAVFPETLKAWLIKFDPLYLGQRKDRDHNEHWREVYACFPLYRVTKQLDFKSRKNAGKAVRSTLL